MRHLVTLDGDILKVGFIQRCYKPDDSMCCACGIFGVLDSVFYYRNIEYDICIYCIIRHLIFCTGIDDAIKGVFD